MLKLIFIMFRLVVIVLAFTGCSTTPPDDSLRAIDVGQTKNSKSKKDTKSDVFIKPKSEAEIKNAYLDYIKNTSSNDKSRRMAFNRLAEIELNQINQLSKKNASAGNNSNSGNNNNAGNDASEDPQYLASLRNSMELLQKSLKEFPDAKTNDKTLYQLARTQDQLGEYEQSMATLALLCKKYPASTLYAESQFRIAENAFSEGRFLEAEVAYSEVMFNAGGATFHERSLFKRGWTRFKQGLYAEAADDYIAALDKHPFAEYSALSTSDKSQYDDYFRALALSFASLQNTQELQTYTAGLADFKYLFHSYEITSDIYLEQERYSDAADVMELFITANPKSPKIPLAYLKKMEAWKSGKFRNRFEDTLEMAYTKFNPKSNYWASNKSPGDQEPVLNAMREHILQAAIFYQEDYQLNHKKTDFSQASIWYKRYLEHYSAYSQQDKVYSLYAELLSAEQQNQEAMHFFELAAYDGNIVLNKDAAYATIVLSNKLYEQDKKNAEWLAKHLRYTLTSAQLYPRESRYQAAALHAAELALNNKQFDKALALANTLTDNANDKMLYEANMIKGLAYIQLKAFADAEIIFGDLSKQNQNPAERMKIQDGLALSIYKQAETEVSVTDDANNTHAELAMQHYARISKRAPTSDIAPKALYEAIVLAMKLKKWTIAIYNSQQFQQLYPKHELLKDATKQLSTAYLNAGDNLKAAQTFEQISEQESNQDVKMASLWKAAELYESKHNIDAAIRSFSTYADIYPRPFPQYMEAMYKLTQLHQEIKMQEKVIVWQEKISTADTQAPKAIKTERTNFIAGNVQLDIAKRIQTEFSQKQLIEPLAENLRAKKKLMQDAIAAFGQASIYNNPAITTEATFAIGKLYEQFSTALLKSERPRNLKGEELEQYNILIEDQAFPFEEKAIEFYEINMAHSKEGTMTPWLTQSFKALQKLFPVRYGKKGKLDIYQDDQNKTL
jgi:cellulose synthase operon protein C